MSTEQSAETWKKIASAASDLIVVILPLEGGRVFTAFPIGNINLPKCGPPSSWWMENAEDSANGNTPDEALANWYAKQSAGSPEDR